MISDKILQEIDAAIAKLRQMKYATPEKAAQLYEELGRNVARLRRNSIAYRRSERRKGQRIREALQRQAGEAQT